ncbi:MAG: 7-methylguanosine phosphate-specific 5'-nucleotidase [Marteilia pararefringens]
MDCSSFKVQDSSIQNCTDEKLELFKKAIKDKSFSVVIDFDFTISLPVWMHPKPDNGSENPGSSFTILSNPEKISSDGVDKIISLFEKYRPIEEDYGMESEKRKSLVEQWYLETLGVLRAKYKSIEDVVEYVGKDRSMRVKGEFKKLLAELCSTEGCNKDRPSDDASNKAPRMIIVSAGLGEVIEAKLSQELLGSKNVKIVSNRLLKEDSPLITSQTKDISIVDQEFLLCHQPECILLVGDNLKDCNIVTRSGLDELGKSDIAIMKVGLLNFKPLYEMKRKVHSDAPISHQQYLDLVQKLNEDEQERFKFDLESFNAEFDLVVINDESLQSVVNLLS